MAEPVSVRLSAGTLRAAAPAYVVPHAWTDEGIAVEGGGTGAHLLHAAVAGCVLNDTYREAEASGVRVTGVAVTARGGFDEHWSSTGITYAVELDGPDAAAADDLTARVDAVAEIPRAVRAGTTVERTHG